MSRLLLAAPWAVLLAASLLPGLASQRSVSPPVPQAETADLVQRDMPTAEESDDHRKRRDQFVEYQKGVLIELFTRRITLTMFVDRVMTHSLACYPEHLENVDRLETGRSLREKIARNVLREYEKGEGHEPPPSFEALRGTLEAALQAIVEQP